MLSWHPSSSTGKGRYCWAHSLFVWKSSLGMWAAAWLAHPSYYIWSDKIWFHLPSWLRWWVAKRTNKTRYKYIPLTLLGEWQAAAAALQFPCLPAQDSKVQPRVFGGLFDFQGYYCRVKEETSIINSLYVGPVYFLSRCWSYIDRTIPETRWIGSVWHVYFCSMGAHAFIYSSTCADHFWRWKESPPFSCHPIW